MMTLTTKILLTTSAGSVGIAGWMVTQDPVDAAQPNAAPISAADSPRVPTPARPQIHWEQRRKAIRAALPPTPTPVIETAKANLLARRDFSDLVAACMEDLETEQTGAVTIALREIGAPDVGTIFESVKVVHSNFDDAEVVECLTQSMYGYVGDAPEAPFERQFTRTLKLGAPDDDDRLLHQITGRIVGAHIYEVRFCESKAEGEIRGTVNVAMTMGDEGLLASSEASASDVPQPVVDCIVAATRRWKFPAVDGGATFMHTFDLPVPEHQK